MVVRWRWSPVVALACAWLLVAPGVSVLGALRSHQARRAPLALAGAAPGHSAPPGTRTRTAVWRVPGLPRVVRQSTPRSCGPAALATLLAWRGRPLSESDVLRVTHLGPAGVTLGEFARLAGTFGLPGTWFEVPPAALDRLRPPFVAHLARDGGHFVVVRGIALGYVLLADPARGWRLEPRGRFLRTFRGRVFLPSRGPTASAPAPWGTSP